MNPYRIKELFTVREAACAIHDIEQSSIKDQPIIQPTINTLISAIESGELPAKIPSRETRSFITREVSTRKAFELATIKRMDLLEWCEKNSTYPKLLFPKKATNPLQSTEKKTLLKIIRALAELQGITARKTGKGDGWHTAADNLLRQLSKHCPTIHEPCSSDTLEKHLRAAFLEE